MAFALTDISVVVALGLVLVVVYFLGSYWKHRMLTRYARWFEEKFSGRAKVQFASYGHAGLRVKCEMNDRSDGFREIYFAISLGARENLMYYPLLLLMHNSDRVSCWGIVEKPVRSNLRVMNVADKKQVAFSESLANMRRLETSELDGLGYVAYASNKDYSRRFLSQAGVASALKGFGETELIELDMTSSMIRLISKLKEGKLPALTGFVAALGRAV